MRTQDEIVARIKSTESLFGFHLDVLLPVLDFEHAREFLKEGVEASAWEQSTLDASRDGMREYMTFAWEKARDHRGLSAGRSVEKMTAWVWLLGSDEQAAEIERLADDGYPQYGAPVLKRVCEMFGLSIPEGEDVERMARGEPCRPDCSSGCGEE